MGKINQEEYNKTRQPTVKAGAVAIIVKDSKILLTRRAAEIDEAKKWCLPGGHIDIGETALECIIREIKEETGFEMPNPKFEFYFDEFIPRLRIHSLSIVFSGKVVGKPNPNEEVAEQKWFKKEEIDKLDIAFKHREIINKFFNKNES